MELRQLEYFIAVAEEANFTRAAERVHISQPGISAQIRQLEHDLGATLIDRSGRTARLTTAGEAALTHARAALAATEAVRRAVDEVTGLIRGRLVVGMVTACTVTPLFDALSAFHSAHPGVEISLIEDTSDRLVEHVRGGTADLALIGAAGAPPAEFGALTVISERLAALVPVDHPLVDHTLVDHPLTERSRSTTTLDAVCAHPIVSLPEGTGIRAVFDQGCAAKGIRPDIALQASAPAAVADLALRGLGVGILSESMAAAPGDAGRLAALPIEDIDTPGVLALIWTATHDPALRELLAHCRRAFPGTQ
jgi:DNA-binding transcriptional LysR family regulator